MTDEIQTPETKTRQKPTRCYIDSGKFILRTLGQADVVVPMPDLTAAIAARLTWEMMAVLLLRGEATLGFDSGETRQLVAGDHFVIPAHCRHRVERCSPDAVWLALHYQDEVTGGQSRTL